MYVGAPSPALRARPLPARGGTGPAAPCPWRLFRLARGPSRVPTPAAAADEGHGSLRVARGISQRDLLGAVSLVAVSLALAWSPLAKADDRPALNADAPAAPAPARPEPVVVRAETFTKPAPDVALPLAESKLLGPADIPDNATPFAILLGVVSASLAAQLTRLNGRISELQASPGAPRPPHHASLASAKPARPTYPRGCLRRPRRITLGRRGMFVRGERGAGP